MSLISKFSLGKAGQTAVNNVKDWGMEVNQGLCCFKGNKLSEVKLIDPQNKTRDWADYERHRFAHSEPLQLKKNEWCIFYDPSRNYDHANNLFDGFGRASKAFQIRVEEPNWCEVAQKGKYITLKDYLAALETYAKEVASSKIVVVILEEFNKLFKAQIKSALDKKGIPSQFIVANNLRNPAMGVLSNLLKTMNAKVGLEIYKVSIPQYAKTMVVGIDVVPSGNFKLVGCCATINASLTKHFNKLYSHKDIDRPSNDVNI